MRMGLSCNIPRKYSCPKDPGHRSRANCQNHRSGPEIGHGRTRCMQLVQGFQQHTMSRSMGRLRTCNILRTWNLNSTGKHTYNRQRIWSSIWLDGLDKTYHLPPDGHEKSTSAIVTSSVRFSNATTSLDRAKGKRNTMNRMTGEREGSPQEKWTIMTADVMTKWHSKTDFKSTIERRT